MARLDEVFAEYAAEDADFDALAKEQEKLEAIIHSWDAHNLSNQMDQAAAALNLPAWDADVTACFQVVSVVVLHCAVFFYLSQICYF